MPSRMKQLALVQFFTWMGLFCMWIFFSVAVARNVMGATDTNSDLYTQGIAIANNCFATYNFVAFLAAITVIAIVYAFGWLQLMLVTSMGALPALLAGVVPFIVPDALKAVGAIVLAPLVREAIGSR